MFDAMGADFSFDTTQFLIAIFASAFRSLRETKKQNLEAGFL